VIITHDPEVAKYAERILVMKDGMLVEDGKPGKTKPAAKKKAKKTKKSKKKAKK
jgi:ABC-type glutathione transport system ATPase component